MHTINKLLLFIGISFICLITFNQIPAHAKNVNRIHHSNNIVHSARFSKHIHGSHIHHDFKHHRTYTVKATKLHLINSKKSFNLKQNTQIKILMMHQGWTLVQYKNKKGYVSNDAIFKKEQIYEHYFHKIIRALAFKDLVTHR